MKTHHLLILLLAGALSARAGGLDSYNLRLGSQAFGAKYQFTTNPLVVEQAGHLLAMGSDIVKFWVRPTDEARAAGATNLATLLQLDPVNQRLLALPFRHYFAWTDGFAHYRWEKGPDAQAAQRHYEEIYAATRDMLIRFNGSGKRFYLGNWEGDWLLLGSGKTHTNPSPARVEGMRSWANCRQRAIDDARRDTPHADVEVYYYVEVNRVRDAMRGRPGNDQRVVNAVLPFVTNLDFVSYSAYDAQELPEAEFIRTMDYLAAHLSTNKAGLIPGRRVFIGEYGFGGKFPPERQAQPTREFQARALRWGCPFVLFWQVYNNEPDRHFCLIDPQGQPTPCYRLHERFYRDARRELAAFQQKRGRLPTDDEFTALALPLLEKTTP